MTEADLKAASDFIHEWINEEAKLHGTSHMRVVRDALAALIHDQRQAALKEGLTLTVDGLGFKEEPIVLISGASEQRIREEFQRGQRDGYILCQNAMQRMMARKLQALCPDSEVDTVQECIDCLAGIQPSSPELDAAVRGGK